MDPRNRNVVVTGAAGGIGGALVRALTAAGARTVIATDVAIDPLEAAVAALNESASGTTVLARRLDVSDDAATARLVADLDADIGPIDIWFANAGVSGGGGADAPDEVWDRQWRVNVLSHVYAARALLPGWMARREGHLVTTASMAGILTSLGDGVYAATKHAAVGFAEWLAITHAAQGIKVSCICPGAVDTAMLRAGAGGDPARASAVIGGGDVLAPDKAAARILDAVTADRFLILTHPEMQTYIEGKAADRERWIRGMTRLWGRAQELLQD